MERTEGSNLFECTLRELQEHTSDVIRRINEEDIPVVVTHRGRFLALMRPLVNENVESKALSRIIDELPENERARVLGTEKVEVPIRVEDIDHVSEFMD